MIPNDEQSDKGSHNMHRIATRYMHVDRCNETVPSVESAGQLLLSHTHSIVLPAFYVTSGSTVTTNKQYAPG